jgi:hypothetical protein
MDCQRKASLAIQKHGLPPKIGASYSTAWIARERQAQKFKGLDSNRLSARPAPV